MNIKGFLKLSVLHELMVHDMSGYELIKRISEIQDKKPSPGSIYPLLGQLLDKGYVKVKQEGRKKVYSISTNGKKRIDTLLAEKEKMVDMHIKMMHSFDDIVGEPNIQEFEKILYLIKAGKCIPQNADIFFSLVKRLVELTANEDYPNQQRIIRKILTNTLHEIDRLQ